MTMQKQSVCRDSGLNFSVMTSVRKNEDSIATMEFKDWERKSSKMCLKHDVVLKSKNIGKRKAKYDTGTSS